MELGHMIKILLIVFGSTAVLIGGYWYVYNTGFKAGHRDCIAEQVKRLEAEKQLGLKQRDAYNGALQVRNNHVAVLNANLSIRTNQLRELQEKADEVCVNTPIPSRFK